LLLVPSLTLAQTDRSGTTHWAGQEIFREKGCANCHSVYGNGGDEGPDLGERKFYGTYLHLASRMWNHFPKMYKKMQEADVEFHRISAEEMGELITYLSFIRYMGEPGRAYKGTELIEKSCMKCHKFGGRGGDIGPDFVSDNEYMTAMQLVEAMWNHGPDMIDVFEEENIKRPTFKGNDIEHILAAIRSYAPTSRIPPGAYVMGDPAVGERLFTEKGCVRCHSVAGVGGTIGVDFAEVDFDYSATEIAGKMWNHGPKMWEAMQRENITFPSFEEGEMAHILAYLYAIKLEDPPGDPDRGEQILRKKRCLSCHSVHGEGGDVSVDLATLEPLDSPPAMIAAMWNHAPGMREKQLEKKVSWPKLKAEEMADLYAYLNRVTQHGEETP
jgi:cytochrome c2